ncbi:aminotransferase class I/II-fold pyridoxal phosphate-dependent enzyme [Stappia stellulata]|uniref:aminotransferase class I/II-fold pyridoxal phosphate-dependent enzyme n=1 Tax=Stappia stellulata TaxID=71235 RepID=UPI00056C3B67|nr:aminotransferase class I/II-fold pyridoxal phosphate-dependent enzyme [Stappia stellulata]
MMCERVAGPSQGPAVESLHRARLALMGLGEDGTRVGPGMFDPDVVSFAHGEGVRRPFPGAIRNAIEALRDADGAPIENYMFLRRFPDLETEIAHSFCRVGVPRAFARNVVLDAGSTRLMVAAIGLMTRGGSDVVTSPGFYHPLAGWCGYLDRPLHVLPTSRARAYKLGAKELRDWIARTRPKVPPLLVLFNPTMTGAVYSQDELDDLGAVLVEADMLAIEDALFAGSEYDADGARGRLAASPAGERCLTVAGASKLHCLANLRIGWGCGPDWLVAILQDYITSSAASIPHVAKAAALGALRAPALFSRRNVEECRRRIGLVCELVHGLDARLRAATRLNAPMVTVGHPVEAGHSVLLEFPCLVGHELPEGGTLGDGADLTRLFLNEAKVAFAPAVSHGFEGPRVRANVASIGTDLTYGASRLWEDRADEAWGEEQEHSFDDGFAQARELIVSAFAERVEPALLKLLNQLPDVTRPMPQRQSAAAIAAGQGAAL